MKTAIALLTLFIPFQFVNSQTIDEDIYSKAYCAYYTENYDEAVKLFTASINKKSRLDESYYFRGMSYRALRNYASAIKDFSSAIAIDAKYYDAYLSRGQTYNSSNKLNEALSDFKKANSISEKSDTLFYIARTYRYMKNFRESITYYSRALTYEPDNSRILYYRAYTEEDIKLYREAIDDCNKAIALNGKYSDAYLLRGTCQRNLGQFENAISSFKEPLKYDSSCSDAYNDLAWLYATCTNASFRNGEIAIQYAEKAIEIQTDDPNYFDTLAAAYAENNKFSEAVVIQTRAIQMLESTSNSAERSPPFIKRLKLYKANTPCREK